MRCSICGEEEKTPNAYNICYDCYKSAIDRTIIRFDMLDVIDILSDMVDDNEITSDEYDTILGSYDELVENIVSELDRYTVDFNLRELVVHAIEE